MIPIAYRPDCCPHVVEREGMHRHGHYERNAPRGEGMAFSLGSLFIPRFYCLKLPRYLLSVAGLFIAKTSVLVEEPAGRVGAA